VYEERRRRRRVEVSLNALLLSGDKIPRGCRVRDFSTSGMQLQWEAEDWTTAFGKEEAVDIHFSVRHADGRKKLVIPAVVKRVSEDHVGVEFRRAQPTLLTLLDGYRVDRDSTESSFMDPHALGGGEPHDGLGIPQQGEPGSLSGGDDAVSADAPGVAARGHAPHRSSAVEGGSDRAASRGGIPDAADGGRWKGWLRLSLASLAGGVLVAAGAILASGDVHRALDGLKSELEGLSGRLDAAERRLARLDEVESTLSYLMARTDRLNGEMVDLRLGPGAAAQNAGPDAAGAPAEDAVGSIAPSTQAVEAGSAGSPEPRPPVARSGADSAAAADSRESWQIILMSLRNEDSADRLIARARSLDIPVEKHRIRAGTGDFWRLRVSGFASRAAAKVYAEGLKPKLDLEDVWIVRR
jgi:cell division septation protein DedD